MKKLAFGALLVGLLVACGGGGDSKKIVLPDTGTTDAPMACNPLTQAGCAAGEKCTWLVDALMPQYVGHVGCAPDGTANVGDACMYGAAGTTGYDNCKAGSVCSHYTSMTPGVCKQLCDQQGGMPACDSEHVCVTYASLFETGDSTPNAAGVCDLACDPLLDNDFDGSGQVLQGAGKVRRAMKCGTDPKVGCYGFQSGGTPPATGWSCTNDFNYDTAQPTGLRHRVQCTATNTCTVPGQSYGYTNSCNQGYLPLLHESSMVSTTICVALCRPLDCYSGNCGANNVNRQGSANDGCRSSDRVSATGTFDNANDANGGEHCTYDWLFEIDQQGNFLRSPTSDTVGFCYNHKVFKYDSNGDNTADLELPSCGMLGSGNGGSGGGSDASMPLTYWTALDLGCVSSAYLPVMAAGKSRIPDRLLEMRKQMDLPRALYHRTMGTAR